MTLFSLNLYFGAVFCSIFVGYRLDGRNLRVLSLWLEQVAESFLCLEIFLDRFPDNFFYFSDFSIHHFIIYPETCLNGIARSDDTPESLVCKIRLATILGTYQSTLTNFAYLSEDWKKNCQEECLLGVSITGQWDCAAVRNRETLALLRAETEKTNREYAQRFGINASAAITCVKPSGTVSKAFDTASGMHQRHSRYYIQRIRISATDALFKMLKEQGVPYSPEVGQTMETADTFVLEFPVKSPDGAVLKNDLCAIEQLEYWKMVKEYYTDHNPSVTITVDDHEWLEVAYWVYQHWDIIGGLSFLPKSKHIYKLAPYEEIDEQKYTELIQKVGHIDFSRIVTYERHDETDVKVEAACFAGSCDI